mgnify:CR=1 FL=1
MLWYAQYTFQCSHAFFHALLHFPCSHAFFHEAMHFFMQPLLFSLISAYSLFQEIPQKPKVIVHIILLINYTAKEDEWTMYCYRDPNWSFSTFTAPYGRHWRYLGWTIPMWWVRITFYMSKPEGKVAKPTIFLDADYANDKWLEGLLLNTLYWKVLHMEQN